MSKKSIKKILICIIAILMVVFVATKTFASENMLDEIKRNGGNVSAKDDGNVQDIPEGEVKKEDDSKKLDDDLATSSDKSDDSNNNGNSTPTAPTTTPYTGIGDYSTYVFIGIFAVSAIYAYKKIREN